MHTCGLVREGKKGQSLLVRATCSGAFLSKCWMCVSCQPRHHTSNQLGWMSVCGNLTALLYVVSCHTLAFPDGKCTKSRTQPCALQAGQGRCSRIPSKSHLWKVQAAGSTCDMVLTSAAGVRLALYGHGEGAAIVCLVHPLKGWGACQMTGLGLVTTSGHQPPLQPALWLQVLSDSCHAEMHCQ